MVERRIKLAEYGQVSTVVRAGRRSDGMGVEATHFVTGPNRSTALLSQPLTADQAREVGLAYLAAAMEFESESGGGRDA